MPTLSLIAPLYNLAPLLPRFLSSVAAQTAGDYELLLLDDGSTDGTLAAARDAAARDARIRVFSQENAGAAAARNRGASLAAGEYLMFLDGDDEVLPTMTQEYLRAAKDTRADIVIGGIRFLEGGASLDKLPPGGGLISPPALWEALARDETGVFGYAPNKLYRAEFFRAARLAFPADMRAQEDLALALEAYDRAQRVALLPRALYLYYHTPGKRDIPPEDLLRNHRRLLALERAHGAPEDVARAAYRLARFIYQILFHAPDPAGAAARLAALPGMVDDISLALPASRGETRHVLSRFCAGDYGAIARYFACRRRLKRLLGKA